jgi:Ca-activated chloride channel homolog
VARRIIRLSLLALALLGNNAMAGAIATDANIVTGLDISDSIGLDELRLEMEGMARAIRSPKVLQAFRSGPNGRIGFAVFAWHHNQLPIMVLPWTLISTEDDALAASRTIEARLGANIETEAREQEEARKGRLAAYIGRRTNLSRAIDHAAEMLTGSPYVADRSVVNIVGNGPDNVGEDASFARDRAVQAGATINGVVLGGDGGVLDYYRRQVAGGAGSFVMATDGATDMVQAMVRKFVLDIAVVLPERDAGMDMAVVN